MLGLAACVEVLLTRSVAVALVAQPMDQLRVLGLLGHIVNVGIHGGITWYLSNTNTYIHTTPVGGGSFQNTNPVGEDGLSFSARR